MRKFIGLLLLLWSSILFGQTSYGDYYQNAEGLKDEALKTALYHIIKGQTEYPYTASSTDVWDMLKQTDKDPNNSANVILLYSGTSVNAAQEYNNGNGWTREHVWAKSRGDFGTEMGPGTDAHHLRPEDNEVNTIRNNRSFDNCNSCEQVIDNGVWTGSYIDKNEWTFEPRDAVKGDVARMIFYMATRYEGENGEPDLQMTESLPSASDQSPFHGRLSTLIQWNREDPVDDWERNRNDIIYTQFQHNRNPYIDHPELIEYIWGNNKGLVWTSAFSTFPQNNETNVSVNTSIRYVYSQAIRNSDDSEITNANVADLLVLKETDSNGADVAFTASIDDNKRVITLTPSSALKNNQIYYSSVAAVEDENENVQAFTEITFTTEEADITAPVIEFDPPNGASNVAINVSPEITFDEAVRNLNDSEITDANVADLIQFKETDSNGAAVDFTATINETKQVITLTTSSNLQYSQVYFISFDAVEDDNNNASSASTITFTTSDPPEQSDVIISQYYEGASNDKYIEITNLGSESVDLSGYYLGRFSNTSNPDENDSYDNGSALSGTIAAGQTLLYKNASAENPPYAVANAVTSTTATYFNGDDPIALMNGGNTWGNRIDCLYAEGTWGAEKSFYRKSTVTTGNTAMSVLDGSGEWTEVSLAQVANANASDSEYLGTHIAGTALGIDDIDLAEISIYPNPNKGKFYILLGRGFDSNTKIEVYSVMGKRVYETISNTTKTEIDLSDLEQGIYFIRVRDGKAIVTQKFIKQ
ncbi:MAG: endonuclease [Bacteroidales bacterium]|nr:endonuclease [Bacteroidales bacterium]